MSHTTTKFNEPSFHAVYEQSYVTKIKGPFLNGLCRWSLECKNPDVRFLFQNVSTKGFIMLPDLT